MFFLPPESSSSSILDFYNIVGRLDTFEKYVLIPFAKIPFAKL